MDQQGILSRVPFWITHTTTWIIAPQVIIVIILPVIEMVVGIVIVVLLFNVIVRIVGLGSAFRLLIKRLILRKKLLMQTCERWKY